MITINSLSGGQSSSYLYAEYPADHELFALIRVEDERLKFPDETLRKRVEDRIQKPFIGTVEEKEIIYTMFDLEQEYGRKINWVSGMTFEELIRVKANYLPNMMTRFCTERLKLEPMFLWCMENIGEVVEMRLGYRANEQHRVFKKQDTLNENGLVEFKYSFEKWKTGPHKGKNKWEQFEWYKPSYPLVHDNIWKRDIIKYWQGRNVRFAKNNNCAGCFERVPHLLRQKWEEQPEILQWFADMEKKTGNTWRKEGTYEDIKKWKLQLELSFDDFGMCDSGVCGL